jgi:large subunit ribosomal protein L5
MSKAEKKEKTPKGAKAEKGGKGGKAEKGGKAGASAKAADRDATAEAEAPEERVEPRLRVKYQQEVAPALMKRFGHKNPMQVPRLEKIVVNVGLGAAVQNPKIIDGSVKELTSIVGQKPIVTRARKSIASFKVREGMPIGAAVTLRRERMWEFMDRLVNLALPRVRDFRGVSPRAFDGAGNYTLGLREQIVFPEVNFDKVEQIKGMNITFVTTAGSNEQARELLRGLGMPFRS